ncbi:MAG: CPBP family intramembrane metalloprotease [Methylococcales bacterium]|nr:CPBP family intramembrane metalloprotease [Methylococcales bacterium]
MKKQALEPENFFKAACLFEGSLLFVAILLGWLADIDCFASLYFSEKAWVQGFFLTLPLILFFFVLQELPYGQLKKIRYLLQETLGARLCHRHWADMFVLAAIAGVSEEVLFRGFLQPWLENALGAVAALLVSNFIFALVHAVTPLYAFLALIIGLYLGVSLDYGGERQLLVPIVIHTLYDFTVFMVILRTYRNNI